MSMFSCRMYLDSLAGVYNSSCLPVVLQGQAGISGSEVLPILLNDLPHLLVLLFRAQQLQKTTGELVPYRALQCFSRWYKCLCRPQAYRGTMHVVCLNVLCRVRYCTVDLRTPLP